MAISKNAQLPYYLDATAVRGIMYIDNSQYTLFSMNTNTTMTFPYSFTIPLDQTKEVEVVLRIRERAQDTNWGDELRAIFGPSQEQAGNFAPQEIEDDINRAVQEVRKTHV